MHSHLTIFGDNNYCYTEAWQRFFRRSSSCPNQNLTTRIWYPSLFLAVWLHQPHQEQTYHRTSFMKALNRIDLFQTGLEILTSDSFSGQRQISSCKVTLGRIHISAAWDAVLSRKKKSSNTQLTKINIIWSCCRKKHNEA